MTATMLKDQELAAAADTFSALEQRVVRAIELLNREREARAETEEKLAGLRDQLDAQTAQNAAMRHEIEEMKRERDTVRTRVERLMASLDSIEAS